MLITPTAIPPFGKGTVGNIAYTVTTKEGEVKPGTAKAFMSDHGLTIGVAKEVEFEKKPPYNNPDGEQETWIKSPPKNGGGFKGGGGGGARKEDPETIALKREQLSLEQQKNEDIKNICDMKDVSIIAQVIFKAAVESIIHETKAGSQIDVNAVDVLAGQYVAIFHKIRAGVSA